jgi:hypothetical protein
VTEQPKSNWWIWLAVVALIAFAIGFSIWWQSRGAGDTGITPITPTSTTP